MRYVLITVDGVLVDYDYDLDPYGTGLNCYRRGLPLPLVRDRGDDYLLDGRSVRIAREALGIGFAYIDILDDDRDGDIAESLYYRYPRLSGLSEADFAAASERSGARVRAACARAARARAARPRPRPASSCAPPTAAHRLQHLVVHARRRRHQLAAVHPVVAAVEVVDEAAGLAHDQCAGRDVP